LRRRPARAEGAEPQTIIDIFSTFSSLCVASKKYLFVHILASKAVNAIVMRDENDEENLSD